MGLRWRLFIYLIQCQILFLILGNLGLIFIRGTDAEAAVDSFVPPKIVIIENEGFTSTHTPTIVTFSADVRPHYVLPKTVMRLALKCQAKYPVMWRNVQSIVAESERIVDLEPELFNTPETYEYSMTLIWERASNETDIHASFVCQAVAPDGDGASDFNRQRAAAVLTLKWEPSLKAVICSLESEDSELQAGSDLSVNVTLKENSPWIVTMSCCIRPGARPEARVSNLRLGYQFCSVPLLCITSNSTLIQGQWHKTNPGTRCGSITLDVGAGGWHVPLGMSCELTKGARRDRDVTNIGMQSHGEFAWLDYMSTLDHTKTQEWTRANMSAAAAAKFYMGDRVLLRCETSTIFYAKGAVWELQFWNSTRLRQHARGEPGVNPTFTSMDLRLRISEQYDQLARISCLIPPWNSTEWVSRYVDLIVEPSTAPLPVPGTTLGTKTLTFYDHETVQLYCNFYGVPPPQINWEARSAIYTGNLSYSGRKLTISVNRQHLSSFMNSSHLPEEQFSCTGSNLAGNVTKVFNVQAIRSLAPTLENAAREAVVMYAGDEDAMLNCSVSRGAPPPQFIWKLHGTNLSDNGNESYEIETYYEHGDGDGMRSQSILIIKAVRLEDEAEYSCTAFNDLGSSTKEFSVRVRQPQRQPLPPAEVSHWNEITIGLPLALFIVLIALSAAFAMYVLWIRNRKNPRRGSMGCQLRAEFVAVANSMMDSLDWTRAWTRMSRP